MIKTAIDPGVPFSFGPWEVVVVESTSYAVTALDGRLAATARREPVAIVVRHRDGKRDRAFNLEQTEKQE